MEAKEARGRESFGVALVESELGWWQQKQTGKRTCSDRIDELDLHSGHGSQGEKAVKENTWV